MKKFQLPPINKAETKNILEGLTREQSSLVNEYSGGALRVLAIPGSGKTHTMIRLHAKCWKALHGARSPGRFPKVRLVTFTNKAASEAGERVERFVGAGARASVSTFHSLALRIIRSNASLAKEVWCENPSVVDIYDMSDVIAREIDRSFGEGSDVNTKDLIQFWSDISSRSVNISDWQEQMALADGYPEEQMADICLWLMEVIRAKRKIPLSLAIIVAASIMERRTRGICDVIIVDEFQDTDLGQFHLATLLVKPYENVIAVGDLHQAIYRWRGAIPENLTSGFVEAFPDSVTSSMTLNFRSTNRILDAGRKVLSVYYGNEAPHVPARNVIGDHVSVIYPADQNDEAEWAVEFVRKHAAIGHGYGNMAILYRNNKIARVIEQALVRNKIPVRIVKGMDFMSRQEVKDFAAYWRWIVDPSNDKSSLRVINVPGRGIGRKTLMRLDRNFTNDFRRKASEGGWPKRTWDDAALLNSLHIRASEGAITPLELSIAITQSLGLNDFYDGKKIGEELRQVSLDTLVSWMDESTQSGMKIDESFDELFVSIAPPDPSSPCVSLMTMHSSKGLEYECVMIASATEGTIPAFRGELQEECHLFYVAVTRAKDVLWISAPRRERRYRKGQGMQWNDSYPSRFLEPIEDDAREDKEFASFRDHINS